MVVEPFLKKSGRTASALLAMLAYVGAALAAVGLAQSPTGLSFHGMVTGDAFGIFFRLVFYGIGILMPSARWPTSSGRTSRPANSPPCCSSPRSAWTSW